MSAIQLSNGEQVQCCDKQSKPSGAKHRIVIDFAHRWHVAARICEDLLHPNEEERFAECKFDHAGLSRKVGISGMNLLQIFNSWQRCKSNREDNDTNDKSGNRSRDAN